MANQWFRLYAEFMNDPKVQMMSEVSQRRLIMLFCARCNSDETLQDEEVTFLLRISPEEWAVTKADFMARKFIDKNNNLLNWDKRQFVSDTSTARVRKHREEKKQPCNVSETPPDTEQNRTEQIIPEQSSAHTEAKNGKGNVGARELPKDFWPDAESLGVCAECGISAEQAVESIRDWAKSKRPRYHDWQATFRNMVRRDAKKQRNGSGGSFGKKPSPHDVLLAGFAQAATQKPI